MKTLLSLLLCVLCLSQAQATQLRLETVKQPLYLLGADTDSRITIADVPYVTYGSDPEWRFSAICAPCRPAGSKDAPDVNLVSLYKIVVDGTYKKTESWEVSRDIEVTIDLSKAAVPEGYPFTIEQVIDAAVTCIKLIYSTRPESEGKLEIKIVGGKNGVKKP